MATEDTTEITPEIIVSTAGGYHAWWPAAKADDGAHVEDLAFYDDFRTSLAERGTAQA